MAPFILLLLFPQALVVALAGSLGYAGLLPLPLVAAYVGRDALLIAGSVFAATAANQRRASSGGSSDWLATLQEVQPLMLSKVNTGLQLATLIGALCCPLAGLPTADPPPMQLLWWLSGFTTGLSGLGYALRGHVDEARERLAKEAARAREAKAAKAVNEDAVDVPAKDRESGGTSERGQKGVGEGEPLKGRQNVRERLGE